MSKIEKIYDDRGNYKGRIENNRFYDDRGNYKGRIENNRFYDDRGNYKGRIENNRFYDDHGNYKGRIENSRLYDEHNNYTGRGKMDWRYFNNKNNSNGNNSRETGDFSANTTLIAVVAVAVPLILVLTVIVFPKLADAFLSDLSGIIILAMFSIISAVIGVFSRLYDKKTDKQYTTMWLYNSVGLILFLICALIFGNKPDTSYGMGLLMWVLGLPAGAIIMIIFAAVLSLVSLGILQIFKAIKK